MNWTKKIEQCLRQIRYTLQNSDYWFSIQGNSWTRTRPGCDQSFSGNNHVVTIRHARSTSCSSCSHACPCHAGCAATFSHSLTIYLKDSNAYGNTYFARYFEWQGICRERWFFECIAPDMLQAEEVFITKHAEHDYVHETFPFQEISCELNAFDIRKCSFWLEFRFYSGAELVSVGRQQIVFANHAKVISALPGHVISKIRRYDAGGAMKH